MQTILYPSHSLASQVSLIVRNGYCESPQHESKISATPVMFFVISVRIGSAIKHVAFVRHGFLAAIGTSHVVRSLSARFDQSTLIGSCTPYMQRADQASRVDTVEKSVNEKCASPPPPNANCIHRHRPCTPIRPSISRLSSFFAIGSLLSRRVLHYHEKRMKTGIQAILVARTEIMLSETQTEKRRAQRGSFPRQR